MFGWYVDVIWRLQAYEKAQCILPHDGTHGDKVHATSSESAIRAAQFNVRVVPNQGAGAVRQRIEAIRRILPSVWFNDLPTEAGRIALGWYHEKIDPNRNIGLGPDHDWAFHGADAFGLTAIDYEAPKTNAATKAWKFTPRAVGA